ncbi:MAG: CBS domain-containing protein [Eubacterium sp.]|nr:CBS domain-containing protein [Eubacterium sp.]MDD7210132.1 CBS domain-containing protein [Lachnospiraceae bacterium]MDY5498375.1 CBS domain-containing protein [Anaerobutyricum sp.]
MNISFYLIPKSEVTYLHQDDTVAQALRLIHKHGYQSVPVIDGEGRYVGTISEGDFLWNLIEEYHMDMEAMRRVRVSSMKFRWDYEPVSIDADIAQLDRHILNQNFVPVVDGRNVFIGIITRKVIIGELLRRKNGSKEMKEENT